MMYIIILIKYIFSQTKYKYICDLDEVKHYKKYCGSNYASIPQHENYKLKKLMVFFRHGDRAPLKMNANKWKDEHCKVCNTKKTLKSNRLVECNIEKCDDGMLSLKGFEQMEKLGKFLKEEYFSEKDFDEKDIEYNCTNVPRAKASLAAMHKGLKGTIVIEKINIKPLVDDPMISRKDCPMHIRIMNKSLKHLLPEKIPATTVSTDFDNYLTHLCNNIPLNCNKISCDKNKIIEYLNSSFKVWKEQNDTAVHNERILQYTFGRLANEILKKLKTKTPIHIFSSHDGTLSSLLNGLGTKVQEHTPYASAIFIEIWEHGNDKNKKDYARIIFNDKVCQTTIDKSTNIPLKKFIEYLKVLRIRNESELKNSCNDIFEI
ncbi:Histidine acid phosphatase [Spraguea lophii 42_110]|uniref:Histidine acid phosphatase n=1 Tax=Spraguea lophii (strain 42_110) TaxID=1358809 RepID=S7WC04_SPRLO|nr:Histidine acid phosphatase [Spraguea lophii 42_110]